jgi:hypothetical protein
MPRKKPGPKPHKPDIKTRKSVEMMSAVGIRQDEIAACLRLAPNTLTRYYRDELDNAANKANAKVAGALFNKAVNGDTTAMIFWLKTRMQWKETSVSEVHNHNYAHMPDEVLTAEEWQRQAAPPTIN